MLEDADRLQALRDTRLMDSVPEERFDRLTRLASRTLGAPVALVSLVDDHRQFFKSSFGLDHIVKGVRSTTLEYSICQRIVVSGEEFITTDARSDPRVQDEPAVSSFGIVSYAGVPLTANDGHVIGSFCVLDTRPRDWGEDELSLLRDLAESVNSEIRLQHAKDTAEAANRAKDRFLAVLSHELRMPISPALMIVQEMVADTTLPQTVREDAAVVRRNIEQQVRLIDDLLDLTRIENGKLDVQLQPLDFHSVVKTAVSHFRAEAQSKRITLSCQLHHTPSTVLGDSGRLMQVFGNLLKNAIKFTPANGTVAVHLINDGASAVVTVRDTGIGISAEILPDLFEAFAQGPRARVREFGGLGLGLAIAKGILDEHGGQIEAASDGERCGTVFTVTVPLVLAKATVKPIAAAPPSVPELVMPSVEKTAPIRILLVDDHEDTLRAMTRLLRKLNHRVVTAGTLNGALAAAKAEEFDLLISDVGLPDGTGLDLMRQLHAERPIRGIALTGYGTDEDHRQTLQAGFAAHLTKPIDMHRLSNAINAIAGENRLPL